MTTELKLEEKQAITKKYEIKKTIKELKNIVVELKEQHPNLASFAILYLYVTIKVYQEIEAKKKFEDNPRMERLDVIFAQRYIDAYKKWKRKEKITQSWQIAFDYGLNRRSMIMQHLLLGMNAHINLDLGIATVEATSEENDGTKSSKPYQNFNSIIKDFSTINEVLNELTKTVENSLADNSVFFDLIRKYGKNKEDILASFSVKYARTGAWYFACYYRKNTEDVTIVDRDKDIAGLAQQIIEPQSKLVQTFLKFGAMSEYKTVERFNDHLIKKLDEKLNVEFDYI